MLSLCYYGKSYVGFQLFTWRKALVCDSLQEELGLSPVHRNNILHLKLNFVELTFAQQFVLLIVTLAPSYAGDCGGVSSTLERWPA